MPLHIVCPHCQVTNCIAPTRLVDQPKCGSCKQQLFNAQPISLTAANFDRRISRNGIPLVVDFWAPWRAPCNMMAPAFEQAARILEPRFRLAKLNTDAESAVAARKESAAYLL